MTWRELLERVRTGERINAAVAANIDRDGVTTVAVSHDEPRDREEGAQP
jgi:hypothetical protein